MKPARNFLYSQKVAPYIFVLPFIITFVIFFIYPIISTVIMSFQSILPGQVKFIGLQNYTRLFNDEIFWKAVSNSFIYMVLTIVLLIPFPMLFASLMNSKLMIGRDVFRAILFIPALTSVVVAGTIFRLMFGELPGSLMNRIIAAFGFEPIKWLKMQSTAYIVLVALACWRWTGVNILYFLAGLKNIPEELYEAADMDGANAWDKFTKITVPLLKPTTIYVLTISIYGGLAMFTESYMLWNGTGSPNNIGLTIVGYLYRQGIERNNMGYASAVGIILLILAMIINLIQLNWTGAFRKENMD